MARGRCIGCGWENVSEVRVRRHIAECDDYAEVYKKDPKAALGPVEAMEAHRAFRESDEGEEAKSEKKADRLEKWVAFQKTKAEQAAQRWNGEVGQASLTGIPLTEEEVLALDGARMYGDRITADSFQKASATRRVILEGFVGRT